MSQYHHHHVSYQYVAGSIDIRRQCSRLCHNLKADMHRLAVSWHSDIEMLPSISNSILFVVQNILFAFSSSEDQAIITVCTILGKSRSSLMA